MYYNISYKVTEFAVISDIFFVILQLILVNELTRRYLTITTSQHLTTST
ncbi:hypothetical protein HMPREF0673_00914 [Leyella stercorea DSM 18206]|uniref:Uncharacterized protein n=1 Tax=Leyella stercorea DSM 18206 TaxID=1002367 RepID=G6AWB6_9BACT|nr:hypothetical protein HMPREF0673_00914 [Leyella stercorea DSM 18206]